MPIGLVETVKGDFIVDEESLQEMKKEFYQRGLDIVIDYEHQTLTNEIAVAGGWIKDFYIKDNAVVAKTQWTKQAKEQIQNKQYKYLSPVVLVRKSDNKAIRLHSVALTNTPAINHMFPLVNSEKLFGKFNIKDKSYSIGRKILKNGGKSMNEEILKELGLDENSSEEDILTKIKELAIAKNDTEKDEDEVIEKLEDSAEISVNKEVLQMLDLKEDATLTEIKSKIMMLKKPSFETEFKELKLKFEIKEAEELIEKALREGKLLPKQKEWAKQYILSDRQGFEEYLKNATVVSPASVEYFSSINKEEKRKIDESTKEFALKNFNLSEEDIKKYGGGYNV